MTHLLRWSACGLVLAVSLAACASSAAHGKEPAPVQGAAAYNPEAFAPFEQRLKAYIALHDKLEHSLPSLPKDATPKQIDTHQRTLMGLLQNARRDAKPGDIFVPSARVAVRQILAQVFSGAQGRELLASTMDENPVALKVKVNDPYPDAVPLSTVPPQVLQQLPKLPDGMEFRFIGRDMILFDVQAHMVVDLVEKAIQR